MYRDELIVNADHLNFDPGILVICLNVRTQPNGSCSPGSAFSSPSLRLALDEEAPRVDLRPGLTYKHSILSNNILLNRANLLFSGKEVGVQSCALRQRIHH